MKWVMHALAIVLGLAMLFMGAQKFGAENLVFQTIAQKSGLSFFEPGFRIFSGVLEVVAGLLMFYTGSRGVGAALCTGIVAGAVVFHLSPWLGTKVALEVGAEPTYSLFTMAVVYLVLALINLFFYRKAIPIIGSKFH